MNIIQDIRNRAKELQKRIIFPESEDPRVLRAAEFLSREKICQPVLTGEDETLKRIARKERIDLPREVEIIAFRQYTEWKDLINHYCKQRKHTGVTPEEAVSLFENNPLLFGTSLTATGYADGTVAGSVGTTGDVISAAIQCIGLAKDTYIVSSTFLLNMPDGRIFTYADCGVVPYPNAVQLADIAVRSSQTHKRLTRQEPVTALLSFSTKGSARHERVELVKEALRIARKKAPELKIDGELQFDAALIPDIAKRKAPGSEVAGKANVFIFPNLDAGNIAYKITERLAGATATGPILQGLAKPMMDLSRGCNWEDVVNAACVAALMADENSNKENDTTTRKDYPKDG